MVAAFCTPPTTMHKKHAPNILNVLGRGNIGGKEGIQQTKIFL